MGLSYDKMVKISESGTVKSFDTLISQILAVQEDYERRDSTRMGQISLTNLGSALIFTGIVWSFPDRVDGVLPPNKVLGRRVYISGDVRLSSRILRGQDELNKLGFEVRTVGAQKERPSLLRMYP
jgi:hypothetical protein